MDELKNLLPSELLVKIGAALSAFEKNVNSGKKLTGDENPNQYDPYAVFQVARNLPQESAYQIVRDKYRNALSIIHQDRWRNLSVDPKIAQRLQSMAKILNNAWEFFEKEERKRFLERKKIEELKKTQAEAAQQAQNPPQPRQRPTDRSRFTYGNESWQNFTQETNKTNEKLSVDELIQHIHQIRRLRDLVNLSPHIEMVRNTPDFNRVKEEFEERAWWHIEFTLKEFQEDPDEFWSSRYYRDKMADFLGFTEPTDHKKDRPYLEWLDYKFSAARAAVIQKTLGMLEENLVEPGDEVNHLKSFRFTDISDALKELFVFTRSEWDKVQDLVNQQEDAYRIIDLLPELEAEANISTIFKKWTQINDIVLGLHDAPHKKKYEALCFQVLGISIEKYMRKIIARTKKYGFSAITSETGTLDDALDCLLWLTSSQRDAYNSKPVFFETAQFRFLRLRSDLLACIQAKLKETSVQADLPLWVRKVFLGTADYVTRVDDVQRALFYAFNAGHITANELKQLGIQPPR